MALEAIPLQWFDKLIPRSIWGWKDLQRALCENFAGIIMHPITHADLKGLKQKGSESLRDYYRRFGELRAQVHASLKEKKSKPSPTKSWPSGNFRTSAKRTQETMKNSDTQ
jgi:hypothetical protein